MILFLVQGKGFFSERFTLPNLPALRLSHWQPDSIHLCRLKTKLDPPCYRPRKKEVLKSYFLLLENSHLCWLNWLNYNPLLARLKTYNQVQTYWSSGSTDNQLSTWEFIKEKELRRQIKNTPSTKFFFYKKSYLCWLNWATDSHILTCWQYWATDNQVLTLANSATDNQVLTCWLTHPLTTKYSLVCSLSHWQPSNLLANSATDNHVTCWLTQPVTTKH